MLNELHKPITRKLQRRELYSSYQNNIWGADLANVQLIRKYHKGVRFLLCVIDIYSKYSWVVDLEDNKGIAVTSAFQKFLEEFACKPNKARVDQDSRCHHKSMKYWLHDHGIEMYSTQNEGNSVVAERIIRILKTKIYKHMTAVSKNVYIHKLDKIVNKYKSSTYHRTIKWKPDNVKVNTYTIYSAEHNMKDPKFKVGEHVRTTKYKNIFAKV